MLTMVYGWLACCWIAINAVYVAVAFAWGFGFGFVKGFVATAGWI